MKTTIPKLRRMIRKTLTEALNKDGLDPNHLEDLAEWIAINTEAGMEQGKEETINSYIEACADSRPPEIVDYEFVAAHLDSIIDKHPSIVDEGGFVIDLEARDSEEEY